MSRLRRSAAEEGRLLSARVRGKWLDETSQAPHVNRTYSDMPSSHASEHVREAATAKDLSTGVRSGRDHLKYHRSV